MINGPKYEGLPCARCGATTRYVRTDKCVACVKIWNQIWHRNKVERAEHRGAPCTICGDPMTIPCYDHKPGTELFRGWLCPNCNRGLGCFQDSPELLARAIEYLKIKK